MKTKTMVKALGVRTASIEEIVEAFETKRPMSGITDIGVHPKAHADELADMAVLRKYGGDIFPEITKVGIKITTAAWIAQQFGTDDLAWVRAMQAGILLVGTGGGPFDEHSQEADSSLSLVAEFLGVSKNQELRRILTYINYEDSHGERGGLLFKNEEGDVALHDAVKKFMFASMVKDTWRTCKENEIENFTKFFVRQLEMVIESCALEIRAKEEILPKVIYLELPKTTTKKDGVPELAVIRSDNVRALNTVLEGNGRPNLVAILQIERSGRFQIHTVGRRVDLRDTVQIIREEIVQFKNQGLSPRNKISFDWKKAGSSGNMENVPEINFYRARTVERIFNGSTTQPDTAPTIGVFFSEEKLIEMVLLGLQDRRFFSKHQASCEKGGCPKRTNNEPCRLYTMGLSRCRTNGFHLKKDSAIAGQAVD